MSKNSTICFLFLFVKLTFAFAQIRDETDTYYSIDIYKFEWSYANIYDDKMGTLDIILLI